MPQKGLPASYCHSAICVLSTRQQMSCVEDVPFIATAKGSFSCSCLGIRPSFPVGLTVSYFYRTSVLPGLTSLLIQILLLTQMLLVILCQAQKIETAEYQLIRAKLQSYRNIPDFFFVCIYIWSREICILYNTLCRDMHIFHNWILHILFQCENYLYLLLKPALNHH